MESAVVETENVHTTTSDFADRVGEEACVLPVDQFSRYMQYTIHTHQETSSFWRHVVENAPLGVLVRANSTSARRGHCTRQASSACPADYPRQHHDASDRLQRGVRPSVVPRDPAPRTSSLAASYLDGKARPVRSQKIVGSATSYACCVACRGLSYHPKREGDAQRVETGHAGQEDGAPGRGADDDLGIARSRTACTCSDGGRWRRSSLTRRERGSCWGRFAGRLRV